MLRSLAGAPLPPLVFGLSGLIPFVALAILVTVTEPDWYAFWMLTLSQYAAVILAFVGALHWGYAVSDRARGTRAWVQYGWSVVPALIGWAALQFPVWTALRVLAAGLLLSAAVDQAFARALAPPPWLLPLRHLLSAVAALCLLAASFG